MPIYNDDIQNKYVYNKDYSNLYLTQWDMPYNWNYKSAVLSNVGWMPSYELNNGTWVNLFGEPVGEPEGVSEDGVPDTSWHENWLGNRQLQLKNNMNATAYPGNTYNDTDAFNMFQDEINNLKSYREYIPAPGTRYWKEGLAGITEYGPREINYNSEDEEFIHHPSTLIVHERTHGLDNPEAGIKGRHIPQLNMIDSIMHDTYGKNWIYDKSYTGNGGDTYTDDPAEIYARMMSIRHDANLNPNTILNADDIEKLKLDPRVTDYDKDRTLDRYDNDTLLRLFNEVAQNNTDNDMVNYAANGGSIHINPKNKGKFNATKKRTGKTTEELTHSKNPLTRKRAIFALNAKKWKHDDGGPLIDASMYIPWIDDAEREGYRDYMWRLAATKAGEWGDPLEEVYDYMLNDPSFNYRRWYNTSSPEELERFLQPGAGHWRDKDGKTVWHPTTSKESPYSGYINPYNPKGIEFGDWYSIPQNYVEEESGIDRYELSDDQINNNWDINRTYRELAKSRANPNELNNSYITYKGGVMIPELTVSPTGNYYPQNTTDVENIGDIIPYPSKKANGGNLNNNFLNNNNMNGNYFATGGYPTDPPFVYNRATGEYDLPEVVVTPNRFSEGLEETRDAQNLYNNYENTLLSLTDYAPNMSALEAQKAQELYLLRQLALEEAIDRRYRDDINEAMRRYFMRKRACGGNLYAEGGEVDPAMMLGGEVPPEAGGMPPEMTGAPAPQGGGMPVPLEGAPMPEQGGMPVEAGMPPLEEYPKEEMPEEEGGQDEWEEGFWEARDEAMAEGKKTFEYDGKVYPTDLGARNIKKKSKKKKYGGSLKVPKEILPY